MDNLTIKELEEFLLEQKQSKKNKKRMKTSKKAFWIGFAISILLIIFSGAMVVFEKDTQSVAIFAGSGVAILPIMFGIYRKFSTDENIKSMEMEFNPNYDEENNLY